MIKPAVLDAMVAAGCTAEQIAAVVKADQAASSGAVRQARYRARLASQSDERDVTDVTVTDKVSPKKETSPTPPKEKTTPSNSLLVGAREFDQFWDLFPNKVGKRKAQIEFISAQKRASFDAIMAGLRRYVAKTDDRAWCNPSTFLHQDRWDDQPAPAPLRQATAPPKPKTVGQLFREDAQRMGLIDDPDHHAPGRLEASDGTGQGSSSCEPVKLALSGGW